MYHHGHTRVGDRVTWRVWAPNVETLELVVHSGGEPFITTMERSSDGWYSVSVDNCTKLARYAFRLDGDRVRPDPASRWQPDGVHNSSALYFPDEFIWLDAGWKGIARKDLVLYELHVGTFTAAGTFDAIIGRLPELCELGVTAIELMPIAQFPGTRNWGYDGVHPFAVQNSYGGPTGLQRLVDACHSHSLALFLDVVYNHLGPEGNYIAEFGPYFTSKHQTPWGSAFNMDDDSQAVRQFFLDNVRYWLREFHVDGLRLDAVHAITDDSCMHILCDIQQVADEESKRQGRAIHVIAESNSNDVRLVEPTSRKGYGLAAQWNDDFHHSVHALLTGERSGYYSDFGSHHQLVKTLNDNFAYDGCRSVYRNRDHGKPARHLAGDRFVASIQNHDQIGNRPAGDRLGLLLRTEQQRLAAGVLILSPFLPLLFMGEEYGETQPFPYFCSFQDPELIQSIRDGRSREFAGFDWGINLPDPQSEETFRSAQIRWEWRDDLPQSRMRNWYRALLKLRRGMPPLRNSNDRVAIWHDRMGRSAGSRKLSTEVIEGLDGGDLMTQSHGVLELIRSESLHIQDSRVVSYFNFSDRSQDLTGTYAECVDPTDWQIILSSEWPEFGGRHLNVHSPPGIANSWQLLPFEVIVLSTPKTEENTKSSAFNS